NRLRDVEPSSRKWDSFAGRLGAALGSSSFMSDPLTGRALAPADVAPARIRPLALFVAFSEMALSGFGGVLPFAYRALVERRRWLTPEAFAKLLAFSQVMPGPTICNLSVMFGYRAGGIAGSASALGGMIAAPMAIVLGLG